MKRRAISPGLPVGPAARRAIDAAFGRVARRLPAALGADPGNPEPIHRLRIATRRASVVLRAFEPCLPPGRVRKARRLLRDLRRGAARARDLDVQRLLWTGLAEEDPALATPVAAVLESIDREHSVAIELLRDAADDCPPGRLRRARKRLVRAARRGRDPDAQTLSCGEFALHHLDALAGELRRRIEAGPGSPEALHEARIEVKRLRYALELFRDCVEPESGEAVLAELRSLHDLLGEHQDLVVAVKLLDELGEPTAIDALRAPITARLRTTTQRAVGALEAFGRDRAGWSGFTLAA